MWQGLQVSPTSRQHKVRARHDSQRRWTLSLFAPAATAKIKQLRDEISGLEATVEGEGSGEEGAGATDDAAAKTEEGDSGSGDDPMASADRAAARLLEAKVRPGMAPCHAVVGAVQA